MSAIPGGIPFSGLVAPTDSTDTYAVTDETYNRGGFRSVADSTARIAITPDRRLAGMWVHQLSDDTYWTLSGGITNSDWVQVSIGGGSNLETYIAGEIIPPYTVVYISNSGQAFIASNDNLASRDLVRGITTTGAVMGDSITVAPAGIIINNAWTWGANGVLFLQTNGQLDIVPPSTTGKYIQKIAIIKSSMVILLEIDNTIGI